MHIYKNNHIKSVTIGEVTIASRGWHFGEKAELKSVQGIQPEEWVKRVWCKELDELTEAIESPSYRGCTTMVRPDGYIVSGKLEEEAFSTIHIYGLPPGMSINAYRTILETMKRKFEIIG